MVKDVSSFNPGNDFLNNPFYYKNKINQQNNAYMKISKDQI